MSIKIAKKDYTRAAHSVHTRLVAKTHEGGRRPHIDFWKRVARRSLGLGRMHTSHWDAVVEAGRNCGLWAVDTTTLSFPILVLDKGETRDAYSDSDRLIPAILPCQDEDTSDDPTVDVPTDGRVWGLIVSYDDPTHRDAYKGTHLYLSAWIDWESLEQAERLARKDGATLIKRIRREGGE